VRFRTADEQALEEEVYVIVPGILNVSEGV